MILVPEVMLILGKLCETCHHIISWLSLEKITVSTKLYLLQQPFFLFLHRVTVMLKSHLHYLSQLVYFRKTLNSDTDLWGSAPVWWRQILYCRHMYIIYITQCHNNLRNLLSVSSFTALPGFESFVMFSLIVLTIVYLFLFYVFISFYIVSLLSTAHNSLYSKKQFSYLKKTLFLKYLSQEQHFRVPFGCVLFCIAVSKKRPVISKGKWVDVFHCCYDRIGTIHNSKECCFIFLEIESWSSRTRQCYDLLV